MKFKITLLIYLCFLNINAQKTNSISQKNIIKRDSIHMSKVCFGGLCLGDSLDKVRKILGNPLNIEKYDGDGEMDETGIKTNSYFYGNKEKTIGIDEVLDGIWNNKIHNVSKNDTLSFNEIRIGSSIEIIKKIFPSSYKLSHLDENSKTRILEVSIYGRPEYYDVYEVVFFFRDEKLESVYSAELE